MRLLAIESLPDFDEARRQDVQAEPAQELRRERHLFWPALIRIVLVAEGDGAGRRDRAANAAVADGHAMRVAREVGEHRARARKGPLGIDHPGLAQAAAQQLVRTLLVSASGAS